MAHIFCLYKIQHRTLHTEYHLLISSCYMEIKFFSYLTAVAADNKRDEVSVSEGA